MAQITKPTARKSAGQAGYTLVEVLIAMVILLSLMFTANYSYSLYSQYWAGRLGSFDRTMFQFQGMLQVKETIEAAIPYLVKDGKGGHGFYFLGRDQGVTFVTAAPIFAVTGNDAAVVRIFAEKQPDGYQLVYEEAPLADSLLVQLDQQLNFKYRTVLLSTVQPLSFAYYGWQQREHKYDRQTFMDKTPDWRDNYDGALTRVQPLTLKLQIGSEHVAYQLASGHDKLINFYIEERIH